MVFHETDGITNLKRFGASVALLDFTLIELCVDGAVNIVRYDKLSDFGADIVHVTLLLCLHQLQVFLAQCTLPAKFSYISLILSAYLIIRIMLNTMTEQVIQGSLWETEKDELGDEEKTEESSAEEEAE
jgi:hypothetical protein